MNNLKPNNMKFFFLNAGLFTPDKIQQAVDTMLKNNKLDNNLYIPGITSIGKTGNGIILNIRTFKNKDYSTIKDGEPVNASAVMVEYETAYMSNHGYCIVCGGNDAVSVASKAASSVSAELGKIEICHTKLWKIADTLITINAITFKNMEHLSIHGAKITGKFDDDSDFQPFNKQKKATDSVKGEIFCQPLAREAIIKINQQCAIGIRLKANEEVDEVLTDWLFELFT